MACCRVVLAVGVFVALAAGCGASDGNTIPSAGGDGGTGTGGGSAAASPDGGVDPAGAGPGGDTVRIACGGTTCAIASQTCCVAEVKSGSGKSAFACVDATSCPESGGDTAALKCGATANCATGTVCCIRKNNDRASSECKAACSDNEGQLCDSKATSTGCPGDTRCSTENISNWGNLPEPYATCGGRS